MNEYPPNWPAIAVNGIRCPGLFSLGGNSSAMPATIQHLMAERDRLLNAK